MNGNNMTSNIEIPINQYFSILTTLGVPDVNLDDYHVRF